MKSLAVYWLALLALRSSSVREASTLRTCGQAALSFDTSSIARCLLALR